MLVNIKNMQGGEKSPIALRCKEFRESLDLSQREISLVITEKGVATWQFFESGERIPRSEHLIILHEKYGLDPTWLLIGEEKAPSMEPGIPNLEAVLAILRVFLGAGPARQRDIIRRVVSALNPLEAPDTTRKSSDLQNKDDPS